MLTNEPPLTNPFEWEEGEDAFPPENAPLVKDDRTEARICAVQALYNAVVMNRAPENVEAEFKPRLGKRKADKKLFALIMEEAGREYERILALLEAERQEGWTWARMDPVLRALCVAGTAELMANANVGVSVILNEYLNIAKGFLEPEDVAYLNRTLDSIAKKAR